MHPMIDIIRLDRSPISDPEFGLVINYPEGQWRFKDRTWGSVEEARAEVPTLQATGRIPSDDELTAHPNSTV
jgi:hypothetical protein